MILKTAIEEVTKASVTAAASLVLGWFAQAKANGRKIDQVVSRIAVLEVQHATEARQLREIVEELKTKLAALDENVRDSSHDFADQAELAEYINGEYQRWNEINRTLGQIQGALSLQSQPIQTPTRLKR